LQAIVRKLKKNFSLGFTIQTISIRYRSWPEGLATETTGDTGMTIAVTILKQLGNGRFVAMTGAKNLISHDDGLSFKIGRNSKKVTHCRVRLTSADEYIMEFMNIRGVNFKTIAVRENVYCDQLQTVFTSETGLDTHL
jgi:hypothetical protein